MSQKRNVGPCVSRTGGPEQQVIDLEVLVAITRLEMEISRSSQDANVSAENTAFLIGPAGEPLDVSPREKPIEL